MPWREFWRNFHLPLQDMLVAPETQDEWSCGRFDAAAVEIQQRALHGACLAAESHAAPGLSNSAPQHLVCLETALAAACFAQARRATDTLDALLPIFRPCVFLYEANLRGRSCAYLALEDGAAPDRSWKGLAAVAAIHSPRLRSLGEAFFVPPVLHAQGPQRERWIGERGLDLPCRGERGGPFWRLGQHGLWRLETLSWSEVVLLAGLLATSAREVVLVAPPRLMPRIGFIAQVAAETSRRVIGVPLDACPKEWRPVLRGDRQGKVPQGLSLWLDVPDATEVAIDDATNRTIHDFTR